MTRRYHYAIVCRLDRAAAIFLILEELVLKSVGGVLDKAVTTASSGSQFVHCLYRISELYRRDEGPMSNDLIDLPRCQAGYSFGKWDHQWIQEAFAS